ncbi:MAG: hypothetical protein SGILL_006729, partial [Bacillariaceae sp.]
ASPPKPKKNESDVETDDEHYAPIRKRTSRSASAIPVPTSLSDGRDVFGLLPMHGRDHPHYDKAETLMELLLDTDQPKKWTQKPSQRDKYPSSEAFLLDFLCEFWDDVEPMIEVFKNRGEIVPTPTEHNTKCSCVGCKVFWSSDTEKLFSKYYVRYLEHRHKKKCHNYGALWLIVVLSQSQEGVNLMAYEAPNKEAPRWRQMLLDKVRKHEQRIARAASFDEGTPLRGDPLLAAADPLLADDEESELDEDFEFVHESDDESFVAESDDESFIDELAELRTTSTKKKKDRSAAAKRKATVESLQEQSSTEGNPEVFADYLSTMISAKRTAHVRETTTQELAQVAAAIVEDPLWEDATLATTTGNYKATSLVRTAIDSMGEVPNRSEEFKSLKEKCQGALKIWWTSLLYLCFGHIPLGVLLCAFTDASIAYNRGQINFAHCLHDIHIVYELVKAAQQTRDTAAGGKPGGGHSRARTIPTLQVLVLFGPRMVGQTDYVQSMKPKNHTVL